MLRIGLCDDENNARDALRFQLEKVLDERDAEIVYEFSSGKGAVKWLKNHPGEIDLLFLDIEMDGLSGMETAGEIRKFNQELMIVFVTGYADFVFDGYQVGALDYMMKPVDIKKLFKLMERVYELLDGQEEEMFSFKNADGTFRMPISQIAYFYSDKRKVTIVLDDKEYPFYGKLNEIEEQMKEKFVRIHQRYLVNPDYVEHIGSDKITALGKDLPMSRSMKETATSRLAKAMLRMGGVS